MSASPSRSKHTESSSNFDALRAGSFTLAYGPVDQEATEFLTQFVHPFHNQYEGGDVGNSDDALMENKERKLPWWKMPSPWW